MMTFYSLYFMKVLKSCCSLFSVAKMHILSAMFNLSVYRCDSFNDMSFLYLTLPLETKTAAIDK